MNPSGGPYQSGGPDRSGGPYRSGPYQPDPSTGQLQAPPNVAVQRSPSELVIRVSQRNSQSWSMLAMMLILDVVMAIVISVQLSDGGGVSALTLFFTLAGVVLTYYGLVLILNATEITVTRADVRVRQKPLPWFGNARADVAHIRRLDKEEVESPSKERYYHFYRLSALMDDDQRVRLLGSLPTGEIPEYVRGEIKGFLGFPPV